jgi:pseudouridine kinase
MNTSKDQLLSLVEANPFISQQELGDQLGLSRSAVAGHLAQLVKEGRILGRAYVLPTRRPIVCLGGTNLDRKLHAIESLKMGSSNPARQSESPGGVARNIAENLARLGLPVHLLTAVGRDPVGLSLLAQLQTLGVDCAGSLQAADTPTGSYTAVLDAQGELVLALAHMVLADRLDSDFLRQSAPQRAAARWLVADLNLPRETLDQLRAEAIARAQSLVVVAVSAPKMKRLGDRLEGIELLVLNRGELHALMSAPQATGSSKASPHGPRERAPDLLDDDASASDNDNDNALTEAWHRLRERGLRRLVISEGAKGLRYSDGDRLRTLPAPRLAARRIREVTGAGDAMTAGIVAALSRAPDDLRAACQLGLKLAALTLQSDHTVSDALHPGLLDGVAPFPTHESSPP